MAHPLTQLLKKNNLYKWNDDAQQAFDALKQKLTNSPVLRYPDFDREFEIHTDASKIGLGVILSEKDDDNRKYVVAYAS